MSAVEAMSDGIYAPGWPLCLGLRCGAGVYVHLAPQFRTEMQVIIVPLTSRCVLNKVAKGN